MHRTFRTTTARRQTYLDGYWDFITDPLDQGVDQGWYSDFPSASHQVWVPGVWNTQRGFLNYEGIAWYRTSFEVIDCRALAICFGAVTHLANVWLDGELLGEHYGGFLPFSFLVSHPECRRHELVVRVDNTHDLTGTIPSARLDWFKYGGIFRPGWVEELAHDGYIASLRLTGGVEDGTPTLQAAAELTNLTELPLETDWTLQIDGRTLHREKLRLNPLDTIQRTAELQVPDAELWSPQQPQLYTVTSTFGSDNLIERVGFRQISVQGTQVLLNGQPLRLHGVHRHDDHPEWGFAVPEPLTLRDLEMIGSLGLNALRSAHYPSDQRLLDLCDERGIMVIEEIPLSDFSAQQLALSLIGDRASAMLWAMIQRDIHHPCIWAWSLLNECETNSQEGYAVVERLAATARETDPSRPITFASRDALNDISFELVDFVTVNSFIGWYTFDMTLPAFLDRIRARIGDKPLLIGEFGAEGLYGTRTLEEDIMWSEEYQRKVVCEQTKYLLGRRDIIGFYIWQFADSRSDGELYALGRPRSYNNKGLLDEYRHPKLVYYALRDLLTNAHQGC
ncbi:MAG: hypothetical protein GXY52_00475 [Chloroflexi bacterium]|nr:hypothetical protein [Chloroflexota bacterium]